MPDITFASFPPGPLALSVSQGVRTADFRRADETGTDPGPVDPGPVDPVDPELPPASAKVTLSANRTRGVSPAGIIFTASVEGFDVERPFHDLRYKWSFGHPGTYRRMAADMPWGRNRNVAYGPLAVHTFDPSAADFAGKDQVAYSVTCEVTDGTSVASGTMQVEVENPDIVFAGDRTICVSPAGNFAGKPADAREYRDLEAVRTFIQGKDEKFRVLLRRGERFVNTADDKTLYECGDIYFGHFGDATAPYPVWGPARGLIIGTKHRRTVTVTGIEFVGDYDPSGDVLNYGGVKAKGIDLKSVSAESFTTIHDCSLVGWNMGVTPVNGRLHTVVSDVLISNWYDFGFFVGETGWIGIAGATIRQNPLTKNLDGKYQTNYANHGPIRISRQTGPVVLSLVDFASFNDWSMNPATAGNPNYSVQPPFRLNNGGTEGEQELVVDRARTQGGKLGQPITNTYNSTSLPVKAVYDKIYHLVWGEFGGMLHTSFPGITMRNVIAVQADLDWAGGDILHLVPGLIADPAHLDGPVEVYNCTFVKLNTGKAVSGELREIRQFPNTKYVSGPSEFTNVYMANNVVMAPGWGVDADQPLSRTSIFKPLPVGKREGETPLDAAYAVPASAVALYRPETDSKAIGSATGKAAIDDFFGRLRGASPSRGAIEPE